MPSKTVISNFSAIEDSNALTHGIQSISNILKNVSSNLAESVLVKHPKPPDKNNLKSVNQYYCSFGTTTDFYLVGITEKKSQKSCKILIVIKLMEYIIF